MTDAFAVAVDRSVVRVSGPDAVSFLQGQLSQDVAALEPGRSALSFLLEPQGKVEALLRVTRLADEEVLLDTDGGYAEAVVTRLERFKLRVAAELEVLDWECVAVRGDGAADVVAPEGALALPALWPGAPGVDLLGPTVPLPDGVIRADATAYELARIDAGMPAMGRELTDKVIPGETLLVPAAVSFTKGCYTGQELVARIDSRGNNVPRLLRRVAVEGAVVPAGAVLVGDGRDAGTLTSAVAAGTGTLALAYVRRDVTPPARLPVRWDGGEGVATVEALPPVS